VSCSTTSAAERTSIVTTDSRTPASDPTNGHTEHARACSCLSRRRALTGFAAAGIGIPFLAACGSDDGSTTTSTPPSDASSSGDSTSAGPESSAGGGAAEGLTTTADVPVGGGTIFADEGVVITQPAAGEFKGFSNICTHQGCPVTSVEDGVIVCNCHNSTFSIEDGSVQGGPASSPLEEVALTVSGDSIGLA
jgi:nitrite reductase/ring-hydroxylating ferredoxin subunit